MKTSQNSVREPYSAPAITITQCVVEQGFAATQGGIDGTARPLGDDPWTSDYDLPTSF